MSIVFHINQFPTKSLVSSVLQQNPQLIPKTSILRLNSLPKIPRNRISCFRKSKEFKVLTAAFDSEVEWEPERNENDGETENSDAETGVVVEVSEPKEDEETERETDSEIDRLKKELLDSFYGTSRGLSASCETKGEILELISQLEAKNPTPAPTEALALLNGKWVLAYTSFPGLFPWLTRGALPLVEVEEISQTIDSENFAVQNSVKFSGPLATTSISSNAKFEVRSPKRVQIKFEEGIIGTPQLIDSIVLPESMECWGQKFDLTPLKGFINSVLDTTSSVAKTISSQPPLKFSILNKAESWLLTTYLDEELRISRGAAGGVFVLVKEGSSLSSLLTS